jgi:hypothetical protein
MAFEPGKILMKEILQQQNLKGIQNQGRSRILCRHALDLRFKFGHLRVLLLASYFQFFVISSFPPAVNIYVLTPGRGGGELNERKG